jgi:hypothetical protein
VKDLIKGGLICERSDRRRFHLDPAECPLLFISYEKPLNDVLHNLWSVDMADSEFDCPDFPERTRLVTSALARPLAPSRPLHLMYVSSIYK